MNNYFRGDFTLIDTVTDKPLTAEDVLFTLSISSFRALFYKTDLIITSDSETPVPIFQKFDTDILWDFGDGTMLKGNNVEHYYKQPGTYIIKCTCFNEDGVPYQNKITKIIKVLDLLETVLTFTPDYLEKVDSGLLSNIHAGELFEIAEIQSSLNRLIERNVPITCYISKSNSTNVFDLKENDPYIDLLPFNSFYNNTKEPIKEILPDYKEIYVILTVRNNKKFISLYKLDSSLIDKEQIILSSAIPYASETIIIDSLKPITGFNYEYAGKIGKSQIYFKDDVASLEVRAIFNFNQDYFPENNNLLNKNSINTVSIGTSVAINENSLTGNEIIFYSTNGLTTSSNITDLASNLFNLNRANYVNIESPFVLRVISSLENPYFIKDMAIRSVTIDSINLPDALKLNVYNLVGVYKQYGSTLCSILPLLETEDIYAEIILNVSLEDKKGNNIDYKVKLPDILIIDLKNFINKDSSYFLNPLQKTLPFSTKQAWETYKTHPLFNDVPNLDTFMLAILEQNKFLENVINKGYNFTDDIANIKTCGIKNLVSILQSINLSPELYNNYNFSKPAVIDQLMKLISINHSILVGTTTKTIPVYTENNLPGPNLGDRINLLDKIYINKGWPKIVCYDRYAKEYKLIDTYNLTKVDENIIKTDIDGNYFQLIDYDTKWGWGLLLGSEEYFNYEILSPEDNSRDILPLLSANPELQKAYANIDKFYTFFYFKDSHDFKVENSYLDPETISQNVRDYDTWTKEDGSIDRLIYKTLIDNLNLT